jgi:hypothetical protein
MLLLLLLVNASLTAAGVAAPTATWPTLAAPARGPLNTRAFISPAAAAAAAGCRYDACWRWSTDGSRHLQHHLQLDTTAGSLQDNLQQLLQFVAGISAAPVAGSEQEQQHMLLPAGRDS